MTGRKAQNEWQELILKSSVHAYLEVRSSRSSAEVE